MSRLLHLGIPDLPHRAFQRDARGLIKPQGGKGSTPKLPDYEALAKQSAEANLDMARYATQANRPNQHTPWGSSTWTNNRQFDQEGYDAAMQAYEQSQQASQGSGGSASADPWRMYGNISEYYPGGFPSAQSQQGAAQQLPMPNRDDFWTGGEIGRAHV